MYHHFVSIESRTHKYFKINFYLYAMQQNKEHNDFLLETINLENLQLQNFKLESL
jgi:hypothetical protein